MNNVACAVCLAVLPLAALAGPAATQHRLFEIAGEQPNGRFGYDVGPIGDLDRDGHADVLVGHVYFKSGATYLAGRAIVVSGRHGKTILEVVGDAADDQLGSGVCGPGDLDRDGYPDLLAGASQQSKNGAGYVRAYSGRTGTPIYTVRGLQGNSGYGYRIESGGDLDRDGVPDFVVGAFYYHSNGPRSGRAFAYSGSSGRLLFEIPGPYTDAWLGSAIEIVPDLNADGHDDLLVGLLRSNVVEVYSGADAKLLFSIGGQGLVGFGVAVSGAGDVDRDGTGDILVGVAGTANHPPAAVLFSGRTRKPIFAWFGAVFEGLGAGVDALGDVDADGYPDCLVRAEDAFSFRTGVLVFSGKDGRKIFATQDGYSLTARAAGDLNRDGFPDIALGQWNDYRGNDQVGTIRTLSVRPLSLYSDVHTVSLSARGRQALQLDAGAARSGRPYALLGSASGTRPGLRVGSLVLPLNPDGYFFLTLGQPNSPLLQGSLGILDGSGMATAAFTAVAGLPPALDGLVLEHAYLTVGASGIDFTSNATPVRLTR